MKFSKEFMNGVITKQPKERVTLFPNITDGTSRGFGMSDDINEALQLVILQMLEEGEE